MSNRNKETKQKLREAFKAQAIAGFIFRLSNRPVFKGSDGKLLFEIPLQIDNGNLFANSPLIYYCRDCGWPCEIKHEGHFLKRPRRRCGECKKMYKEGWMDEAKAACEFKTLDITIPLDNPSPLVLGTGTD